MRSTNPQSLVAGAVLAALLSAAIGVVGQSMPSRSVLALSKRNHTLAIVDPKTLQVIARAPVGTDAHEVIASSDGKTAYVSILRRWPLPCAFRYRPRRTESAS